MKERLILMMGVYDVAIENIEKKISKGETVNTEFKSGIPTYTALSRELSGLANADGGEIFFGVEDNGTLVGTDIKKLRSVITAALKQITPDIQTEFAEVKIREKTIGVLKVRSSSIPVASEAGYFKRNMNNIIGIMDQTELLSKMQEIDAENTESKKIEYLTLIVSNMAKNIESSNSFMNKLKDYILGGLIGVILTSLVSWIM